MSDGKLILQIVQPQFVDFAWRDGAAKLADACKLVDEITGDQLKMILARGERTLVMMKRGEEIVGWGVFRIDQLPNLRVLYITDLYAPKTQFYEFFDKLKDIAKTVGCSRIRCAAQPAHAELYRVKCGFKPVYQVLEAEVENV